MKETFLCLSALVLVVALASGQGYINTGNTGTGVYVTVQDSALNCGLPVKTGTTATALGFSSGVGKGAVTISLYVATNGAPIYQLESSTPIWTGFNSTSTLGTQQGTFPGSNYFLVPLFPGWDGHFPLEFIYYASSSDGNYASWSGMATNVVVTNDNSLPAAGLFGSSAGKINSFAITQSGGGWAIYLQPTNTVAVVGGSAQFFAAAGYAQSVITQWRKNGVPYGGLVTNNSTLTLTNVTTNDSGMYDVMAQCACGVFSLTSAPAVLSVVAVLPSKPAFTNQPVGGSILAGQSFTFSSAASGTDPIFYQWYNGSGLIGSATNTSLTFNPALTNNSGNYFIIASNAYGKATSSVANLVVYTPVNITSQPANQYVPLGAPATFSVSATSVPVPGSYQWYFGGVGIPSATNSSLFIASAKTTNSGSYYVQVGNGYSTTNSQNASLAISPTITTPFIGAAPYWGRDTQLTVGAVGSGTLQYQWFFNGAAISGATNPVLEFSSIQFTNAGPYSVTVTSQYGSVSNIAAQVFVNPVGIGLTFSPTLTITGSVGNVYIIKSSTNLNDSNNWSIITNLTLTAPVQIWVDTNVNASSPFVTKYFYELLPGP